MKTLVLAVLVMLSAVCWSQEPKGDDGNRLLKDCGDLLRHVDDNFSEKTDSYNANWCLGYVQGFVESLDAVEMYETTTYEDYKAHRHTQICLPAESTIGQDIRVIVKFLQDHPETLHKNRKVLTYKALQQAFPCAQLVKTPCRPK